jgi:hypothetical protein
MKFVAILLSAFWTAPALACPLEIGAQAMTAETAAPFNAYVSLDPIVLSQPFDMRLTLCGSQTEKIGRIEIEAIMPTHQHGMNYAPVVKSVSVGHFSVSGMVLHMPGLWQIQVTVFTDDDPIFFSLVMDAQ